MPFCFAPYVDDDVDDDCAKYENYKQKREE